MSIEHAVQSEIIKHIRDVLQIFGQSLWSHRRVLNHSYRLSVAFHSAEQSESSLS